MLRLLHRAKEHYECVNPMTPRASSHFWYAHTEQRVPGHSMTHRPKEFACHVCVILLRKFMTWISNIGVSFLFGFGETVLWKIPPSKQDSAFHLVFLMSKQWHIKSCWSPNVVLLTQSLSHRKRSLAPLSCCHSWQGWFVLTVACVEFQWPPTPLTPPSLIMPSLLTGSYSLQCPDFPEGPR